MDLPPDLEELKARLRELNQDLIERDRELAHAHKETQHRSEILRQREQHLEECLREIKNLRSWAKDLQAQILTRNAEIRTIAESRSWKLTAPVRFVGTALKRARNVSRGFFRIFHQQSQKSDHSTEPAASGPHDDLSHIGAGAEASSIPPVIEAGTRIDSLDRTFNDMLSAAADTTGDGRYIHPVNDHLDTDFLGVKAVAFYRPQTRLAGVSEFAPGGPACWIDVSKAVPRYLGQYQPHIPAELGYYDLRIPEIFVRQVELAKQYGLYGLCFQIDGSEEAPVYPLEQLLSDPALKIAFCVSCADDAILKTIDSAASGGANLRSNVLLRHLSRLFNDTRYIRVGGKPLLVLSVSGEGDDHISQWRDCSVAAGFPGLYVVARLRAERRDTQAASADACVFDPTLGPGTDITSEIPCIDPRFQGEIYSYASMIESDSARYSARTIGNVVTGWDSEPMVPGGGRSFQGSSPQLYARWLERCCRTTIRRKPQERFVFITSWNDWATGAHLEPDRRFGYGYLQATASVLRHYYRDPMTEALISDINARFTRRSDAAVIFHCFYEDLIGSIFEQYLTKAEGIDLFVTVRSDVSRSAIERMVKARPNIFFLRCENRGRDIRPFLFALRHIQSTGYRFACKIHTKKTLQAGTDMGNVWRQTLVGQLLGAADSATQVVKQFNANPRLGLLIPKASVEDLREIRHHITNTFWLDRLLPRLHRSDLIGNYAFSFPAGSMYWFRVDALDGFDQLSGVEDSFEIELGQRDGTLAHALERLVTLYAQQRGYSTDVLDVSNGSGQNPSTSPQPK